MRARLLGALLLIGCTAAPAAVAPTPEPTREPNTVYVSVLLDLSGDRAPSGRPQRDAMQLWLDRPPPTATIKLRVKFVDVASSTAKLLLELRRAVVEDRADAVVVGASVARDDSFAQAAEVAHVPILLTQPASEPILGSRGAFVFALAPAPQTIARAIVAELADRGSPTPMLLATDRSASGIVERTALVNELTRRGISAPQPVGLDDPDGPARMRMATWVARNAIYTGRTASFGDILRALVPPPAPATGIARIYLSYLTETADLSSMRDTAAFVTWPGSGLLVLGLRGGDQPLPSQTFLQSFADRYGQPSTLAGSSHDALTLIETASAVAPAEIEPGRLRQRLEANTVRGVVTTYSFTTTRHVGFSPDDLVLLAWDARRAVPSLPSAPVGDR